MPDDDRKKNALIERIVASKAFVGAPGQIKLLQFLFEKRETPLMAKEIEELHYRYGPMHPKHNPAHSRERLDKLKEMLDAYEESATNERLKCILPNANRGEGYSLEFVKAQQKQSSSELFWSPHLEMAEDVIVVCGHHVFFYDPSVHRALRYYDFNLDRDKEEMLAAFKTAHPQDFSADLEPLHDSYLSTGEVHAHEALQRWFHREAGVLVPRFTSRDTPDRRIHKPSPILMGRPATNRFIRKIMDSPQASHLAYRFDKEFGAIRINGLPDDEEIAALSSRFSVTRDGVLEPVPKWELVFGIVTRLRNPSGNGYITIIAADFYAKVIARIAEALTNDKQVSDILQLTNWPDKENLPDSFEMIFSVALSPGNLEGEGDPELIAWRPRTKVS